MIASALAAACIWVCLAPAPGRAAPLQSSFNHGFAGWNFAGVGDVLPTIVNGVVDSGTGAAKFVLTGTEGRSELTLDDGDGTLKLREGAKRYFAYSFKVGRMQWGRPGAHNLITQLHSDGTGSPNFGLQLWDYAGDDGVSGGRGLWSHGKTMGGDRFLGRIRRHKWNDVLIHFKASRVGAGFYKVFLNGDLVDKRKHATIIRRDRSYMYIKVGLYRNGGEIPGTSELYIDDARLGGTRRQVTRGQPRLPERGSRPARSSASSSRSLRSAR